MMKSNKTVDESKIQKLLANQNLLKEENKRLQIDLAEMKRMVEDKESLLVAVNAARREDMHMTQMRMSINRDLQNEVAVLKKNAERREKKIEYLTDENADLKYIIIDKERDIKNLERRVNQLSKVRDE
ncbi:hypothetical protein DICPUDRAFT_147328 [Dictyostelium purpureum]|uniref:Uncharacterized protein n=1 Tax=Dictyostelium purpureum TaxID=5786 RepID=F0Z881_DICPU|nr:uncharacterized protein DICPUDRAFT_147326 [Dictyostelium purpureum]XP_003283635.1 uncharacterized protein DICPUDRAFT_147328 [Dictyostelium purpureum]EGC39882.1 hypothetical protein DICPUDRAFT_147326 [Dictyostelium purpureum]EGC39884.1 hypothetical protein DICPUDRAFT_147328 [Dictyostelium purpureum]|eukprot:XP_003283633.1 hypothetical protein DICPUDRAFT_147326 [Dictyostelium purpureum]